MILKNCEIWYPHLDPARPNGRFDKKRPQWDIQMRTRSKEQKAEWQAAGLNVKPKEDEETGKLFYTTNLRRRSVKSDGTEATCPDLIDGKMNAVDPRTVGNGSIANVRIFQYEPPQTDDNSAKIGNVLMGVQLTTHIMYEPKPMEDREDFEEEETKVVGEQKPATEDDADHRADDKFTPASDSDKARENSKF